MTTQQIRFFLETADCLNFTEAAKRLFVAQSTLSKQVALLEEELGLRLFYRNNRTVGLTPAGVLLRGELEKVETRLTDAIDRAQHLDRGLEGHLTVGVLDLVDPSLFVTPLLQLFRAQYPKVDLSLSVCGFGKLREGLESGLFDAVFWKDFGLNALSGLNGMDVYRNQPAVLIPSHHILAMEPELKVSQLKNENFVVLSQDEWRASVHTLVDLCGKEGFYPKISKYAESNADRIYYVALGYGISVVDRDMAIPRWADLVTVPLYSDAEDVFIGINIKLAWSRSCTNPSIRLLVNLAEQLIAKEGALL